MGRNFFAPYTPPTPQVGTRDRTRVDLPGRVDPPRVPPSPYDTAKFAVVTGIMEVDGIPFVWLNDRMGGREWHLTEGDRFKVGGGTGEVDKIDPEGEVILRFDGKLRSLHVEDSLREGKELKD